MIQNCGELHKFEVVTYFNILHPTVATPCAVDSLFFVYFIAIKYKEDMISDEFHVVTYDSIL
jgi:hypothetical protein